MMLFSLSRGHVYNRECRFVDRTDAMPARIIQALHRKASYSLARDEATNAYLHSIGCDQAQVGGCPTIFLDRMVSRLPALTQRDQAGVLISVRNPSLMSIPLRKQSQVYGDISATIEFLRSQGVQNVRLLCHDHRDVAFAASFPGIDYVYTGDVYTYLAMLRSCALNISYRLHSVLPCLSYGTPTINISYDERALSLLQTIGAGSWNIDMICDDDVPAQVADRFRRLEELRSLRASVEPRWRELYQVMADTFGQFSAEVVAYRDRVCKE